jgi:hypothetical protein
MKTILRNALNAVLLLLIPTMNFAQAPPLGTAAGFVLFTTVGAVGIDGISQVTGNVGSNSGGITISVNVNGVIGPNAQCATDLLTAYNLLNSTIPTFFPAPLLGNGQTLDAGVYSISGASTLNGNLNLDAQGNANAVFIFQIQGSFSTSANSKVNLLNGAMACNVFWKVEGLVSMASGTTMRGTIIANNAAINILAGDTLEGRALSTTGAVNLHGSMAFTPIGCGSPVLMGPAAPALLTTQCYDLFSSNGPVSNAGITYITGDVGTNVGLTTGFNALFVTGTIHPIPDASTAQCAADLGTVYTYLNTLSYDIELMYPAQFGNNLVLTPHTYLLNAATALIDTLYLNALGNANAVFVIKINGALLTNASSKVVLINGALAKNVFWKVEGAVTLSSNSIFKGTIVCNNGAILLTTGMSLEGRAFTTTGALGTTAITGTMPPGCSGTSSPVIVTQPVNQTLCALSSVSFSVTATGTGLTYQWRKGTSNLTNGGTISGATSSTLTINPVNTSDAASNYNVVVSGTFLPSVTSNNASLTVIPTVGTPIFILGSTSTRCQETNIVIYSSTASNNTGIIYSLDVASLAAGNSIVTSTGAVTYVAGWVGVSMITAVATGCNGPSTAFHLATTNPRPGPTIMGPASICAGAAAVVYTTEGGMSIYTWIVSSGGAITSGVGTNTITVAWTTAGVQTVSVNYTNGFNCPALVPTILNVTVNALPVPALAGPTPICVGSTGNVYSTQAGMTNYLWTVSAGGTITSGNGTNAVTITWNVAGAQAVRVNYSNTNGCTALAPTVFNVIVNALPEPTITGATSICVNSGYYNYTTEGGQINYVWTISSGGIINFGSGTNQIQVSWIGAGSQSVSVNYSNGLGCNGASPTILNVTISAPPDQAGNITGTAIVCAGANGIAYSVPPINGASTYVWTISPNATIATGAGTNAITVNYGSNAQSGNITIVGNNLCGDGGTSPAFTVAVNPLPDPAGAITGPNEVCYGSSGVVYSVTSIANATGYSWTVPTGVNIVTGANTHSITVDFMPTAASGVISVIGTNSCGNGIVSLNFLVTLNPIPSAPIVTNTGYTLYSSAPTGNQWYFEGTLLQGETGQTYIATVTGYYWVIVNINACYSDTSNHNLVIVTGLDTHPSSAINIYPNPNNGLLTLIITSPEEKNYDIGIFNNLGMQIFELKNLDVKGTTHQTIDLGSVANGIYSIVIQSSNFYSVKKIAVNR